MGMFNIMENDVEQVGALGAHFQENIICRLSIFMTLFCLQISQLMQFAEALLEYHKQCSEILQVTSIEYLEFSLEQNCITLNPCTSGSDGNVIPEDKPRL